MPAARRRRVARRLAHARSSASARERHPPVPRQPDPKPWGESTASTTTLRRRLDAGAGRRHQDVDALPPAQGHRPPLRERPRRDDDRRAASRIPLAAGTCCTSTRARRIAVTPHEHDADRDRDPARQVRPRPHRGRPRSSRTRLRGRDHTRRRLGSIAGASRTGHRGRGARALPARASQLRARAGAPSASDTTGWSSRSRSTPSRILRRRSRRRPASERDPRGPHVPDHPHQPRRDSP